MAAKGQAPRLISAERCSQSCLSMPDAQQTLCSAQLFVRPYGEESLPEAFVEQNDRKPARKAILDEPLPPVQHGSILLVEEKELLDTGIMPK